MSLRATLSKAVWLLLLPALFGCDSQSSPAAPSPTPSSQARLVSPVVPIPTKMPQAVFPSIARTADGLRIEGIASDSKWVDDSHLLIRLAAREPTTARYYLADLSSVALYPLPITKTLTLFGNAWLVKGALIAKILDGKYDKFDYTPPGELLLIDMHTGRMQTIANPGEVAVALPDGNLLIRRGWVDAPIELLAVPYTSSPSGVTTGGPWTEKWFVSPDAQWVAWFEMDFPKSYEPYLGKDYLPTWLPSAEPSPQVKSLVLWNRYSGEVRRFAVNGVVWPYIDLLWDRNSKTMTYSAHQVGHGGRVQSTLLTRMSLDGQTATVISYDCDALIHADSYAPDGSLYYTLGPTSSGNPYSDNRCSLQRQFDHLAADGRTETILSNDFLRYVGQQANQLVISSYRQETRLHLIITLLDLGSGNTHDITVTDLPSFTMDNPVSPQGGWVLQNSGDGALLVAPLK